MTTVTLPHTTKADTDDNLFSDVKENDQAIIDVVNGNIDTTNIAANGVGTSEIADGAVTPAKWGVIPAGGVLKQSSQSIGSATFTTVTFAAAGLSYDTTTMFSDGTDSFVLSRTGIWQIEGAVNFDNNTTGSRFARLMADGTEFARAGGYAESTGGNGSNVQVSSTSRRGSGVAIRLEAYQNSGGNLNVLGVNSTTVLSVTWLGPGS